MTNSTYAKNTEFLYFSILWFQSEGKRSVVIVCSHQHSLCSMNFFYYCLEESNYLKFVLAIDVLIMLAVNCRISRLKSLFLRGVKDQLQGIVSCFDTFSKVYNKTRLMKLSFRYIVLFTLHTQFFVLFYCTSHDLILFIFTTGIPVVFFSHLVFNCFSSRTTPHFILLRTRSLSY